MEFRVDEVRLARAEGTVRYPARFQLVLAANPCPCAPALDRDGVVNHEVGYLYRSEDVAWVDGIIPLCRLKPITLRWQDEGGPQTTPRTLCACPDPAALRFVEALARWQADVDFDASRKKPRKS